MDPFRNGAAGVVSSAKLFRPEDFAELTTITASRYRARASRPSSALSVASQLLVDAAATPPLRGGECRAYSTRKRHSLEVRFCLFQNFENRLAIGFGKMGEAGACVLTR